MKRAFVFLLSVALCAVANAQSSDDKRDQARGTGVSGTHGTGDTGTSAAGAHGTTTFSTPNATPVIAPETSVSVGDAQAGGTLATQGMMNKGIAPCMSCHGTNGQGNPGAGFPRLAGLPDAYLRKQLEDYAAGRRNHPVMGAIAKLLTPQQRNDAAAYYAQTSGVASPPSNANDTAAARARALATAGDESLHVQACANCHGPDGAGLPPSYPALAGQNSTYLTAVLNEWRGGNRNNDPSGQMQGIARSLSDSDIAALAALYSSLPAPR